MNDETAMVEFVSTADGSVTGRHLDSGATYRSVFGALTEVRHVFLDSSGLTNLQPDHGSTWRVVELGFGLGTSFAETAAVASELGLTLEYTSVEREPAPSSFVAHPETPFASIAIDALDQLKTSERAVVQRGGISLNILKCEWRAAELPEGCDACYFDPFGPSVNPESWRVEDFEMARNALHERGRLATYSAAGHVRRALAAAGFFLATRPGPGRKREITVASPTDGGLGPFERLSMARYTRSTDD